MLASYLCGGARIVAVKSAVILIVPSHKEGLQTPKKGEEVPVVLPDRRSTIVRLDRAGRKCLGLGGEVDLGIDVRGFDRDVAKPRADGVDIDAGPEQVGRGRVPNTNLSLQFVARGICSSLAQKHVNHPLRNLMKALHRNHLPLTLRRYLDRGIDRRFRAIELGDV